MKKIILLFLSLVLGLLLTACNKEEDGKKTKVENEKQEGIQEEMQEEEIEVRKIKGLILGGEIEVKEELLLLTINLENTTNEEIPMSIENKELFEIKIKDKYGIEVLSEKILDTNRKQINPKEKIKWDKEIDFDKKGEYELQINVLFKDTKELKYLTYELEKIMAFEKKESEIAFIPKKPSTYVYITGDRGTTIVEEFEYFEDGFVQSQNSVSGLMVYFVDETGLYVVYEDAFKGSEENIIDKVEKNRKLLLKRPIEINSTWQKDGITYKITSVNEEVQTLYKEFKDAIKVEMVGGANMYFHEDVGLIKVEANGFTIFELKEIN